MLMPHIVNRFLPCLQLGFCITMFQLACNISVVCLILALLYYRLYSTCRNFHIVGQTVTDALKKLSDGSARKAILGMRTFYKTVIKYLQQMLPLNYILLKSLSCLNPREQRGYNSMQHCMVVARSMPNFSDEEQVSYGS